MTIFSSARRLVLGLAAAAALASVPIAAQQALAQQAPTQKIVVGLDDSFPPMGFRDDDHKLVGFDVDLARAAAEQLDMEVEFKPIDWDAKEAELNGKRVDVLWNGLTITEQRKKNIAFTKPYMENHQIVIVKDESDIQDKAGLAGKTVGAQNGSSAIDAIEKDEKTAASFKALKKYGDNITALLDLEVGRLDAVVLDEVVGRYYTSKKPGKYRVLDQDFGAEEYGVGVRKDDTELLQRLDQVLDALKASDTGAEISEKWFGKNIFK
ncbi:MAG: amino acid ABC transporter substrate-binding protein [Ottowia sp.]|nr:amino acid ABC transporter substrate-binding protein [Ottowia sp.]